MPDDILADIPKEGSEPFKDLEKETPPASPTEKKPEDEEGKDKPKEGKDTPAPEEGDNIPFHKHPRWIERENKLKELEEKYELTAKELGELKTLKERLPKEVPATDIPDWFKESYGEDQAAWKEYEKRQRQWEEDFEKRFYGRIEAKQLQQQQETQKWNTWVENEVQKLQKETGEDFTTKTDTDANGNKVNAKRNELIKVMLEMRPTDEQGNFDFKRGYEMYQLKKPKVDEVHTEARKKLGDAATKTTRGEPKPKDYMTAADLRGKSWTELN